MLVLCNVKINEFCILWIPPSPNASTQICRTSQTKDDFHISRSMSIETRKIDIDGGCDAMLCFALLYHILYRVLCLSLKTSKRFARARARCHATHFHNLSISVMCKSVAFSSNSFYEWNQLFSQKNVLAWRELDVCSYITGPVVHAIVSKQKWNFACGISPVCFWTEFGRLNDRQSDISCGWTIFDSISILQFNYSSLIHLLQLWEYSSGITLWTLMHNISVAISIK